MWDGAAKTWSRYETVSLVLAGLATPLVLSVHTIVSMDFATSVIPGWHTTIFPPYFVAGASKYGAENKIRVDINNDTGNIRLLRLLDVVEEVEDNFRQINLEDAKKIDPNASLEGPAVEEELPPIDFGRVAAQSAKQVIVQKVRDAERERHYEEFKDRVGEIISGVVKRVEYSSVVVDLGRAEAIIRRDQLLPREAYRAGDRVRAYIYEVRREMRGPQIFLSRTHSDFMTILIGYATL